MDEILNNLNHLKTFLKHTNSKILLIKLLSKAQLEYDKFDYESSLKTLRDALKIDSTNSVALRGFGYINQARNKFKRALFYYKKALMYSEEKEIEYTLIGTVYYLQNEFEEAIKYFNLAIDCNDNYDSAYEGRNQAMLEKHVELLDLQESLKKYF